MNTITKNIDLTVSKIVIQTAMEIEECLQLFVPVDQRTGALAAQMQISGACEGVLPPRLERLAKRIADLAVLAFEQGHNPSGSFTGLVELRALSASLAVTVFYQDRC